MRDGVLLCKLLDVLRPGIISKVAVEAQAAAGTDAEEVPEQSVEHFITAVKQLGLPSAALFSAADVASSGWEERPRVVECLLTLKRYHESEQAAGVPETPYR